jgi:hypothetical protein
MLPVARRTRATSLACLPHRSRLQADPGQADTPADIAEGVLDRIDTTGAHTARAQPPHTFFLAGRP